MFLIPYYLTLFLFGIPVMLLETSLGQYFRTSLMDMYSQVSPKYKGVPIMAIANAFVVSCYYIYLMAYCVIYMSVPNLNLRALLALCLS